MRASYVRESADVRRQSLIDAAGRCLAEHGVAGSSVRAICAKAGVSAGLLTHYFSGVDELILAAYRDTGKRVSDAIEEAVANAGTDPRARLHAYVTASFRPPILDPQLLATWIAFWSLVKTSPLIAGQHGITYAGYREGIEVLIAECHPDTLSKAEIKRAAIAITAMVDGLWLELCLDPTTFTPEDAIAVTTRWIDTLVGTS